MSTQTPKGEIRPSQSTLTSLLAELEAAAGLAERLLTRGHDHEAMTALHASLATAAAMTARTTTGPVDLIPGRTGWSAITALLALEARKIGDFGRASGHLYLTTRTGLLDTIRAGHCAQEALNDASQTLGVLLVYTDRHELSEADALGAAWLACGMAELGSAVDAALAGMTLALAHGDHLSDEQEGGRHG